MELYLNYISYILDDYVKKICYIPRLLGLKQIFFNSPKPNAQTQCGTKMAKIVMLLSFDYHKSLIDFIGHSFSVSMSLAEYRFQRVRTNKI